MSTISQCIFFYLQEQSWKYYYNIIFFFLIHYHRSGTHYELRYRYEPTKAPIWDAVRPTVLVSSLLAPAANSILHTAGLPLRAAKCKAVYLYLCLPELTSASCDTKKTTSLKSKNIKNYETRWTPKESLDRHKRLRLDINRCSENTRIEYLYYVLNTLIKY